VIADDVKQALINRVRQNVPRLLRELPVWLLWKLVSGAAGEKPKKVPHYSGGGVRHGKLDAPEDRAQLVDFEKAASALNGHYEGLGIALGAVPDGDITLSGIDLDHCYRGGELDERATKVLLAAQSYSEKSPSGEGLHVLGTGDVGTVKEDANGLEIYSRARYFTVTGDAINQAGLADLSDAATMARKLYHVNATTITTDNQHGDGGNYIGEGKRNSWLSSQAFALRKQGCSIEQIRTMLRALNEARCRPPLPDAELCQIADGKRGVEVGAGEIWTPPNVVTYGPDFDAKKIPQRRWLLGRRRSIGELTVDVGPPGVNKSTLLLADAVAIATGRKILADEVHASGAVRFLAGEDARRDVEARLAGILGYFHISPAELGGKLQVVYLTEHDAASYCLAQMADDLAVLNTLMFAWLREAPGVIATFIDPILAWHRLLENSNEAMQVLSSSLRSLAVRAQQHVGFDHHVTKVALADPEAHIGNFAAVRGGGSLVADARWGFTLARLRPETADAYGIPETERKRYRRLDPLKASYGPDDDDARLLRVESVLIANGEQVGVLVEVDMQRTREKAAEQQANAKEQERSRLAGALAAMIAQKGPCSVRAAAQWLMTRQPDLFKDRKGKPLSDTAIRTRLPGLIGDGLPVTHRGQAERIVLRQAKGKGRSDEIDFKQGDMGGQAGGQ
jgi:hypothetical protein